MTLTSDSDLVPIDLHIHSTRYPLPASRLVSRTGKRGDAHTISLSLMTQPRSTIPVRVQDEITHKGQFRIKRWKLVELGWLTSEDERQGRLV